MPRQQGLQVPVYMMVQLEVLSYNLCSLLSEAVLRVPPRDARAENGENGHCQMPGACHAGSSVLVRARLQVVQGQNVWNMGTLSPRTSSSFLDRGPVQMSPAAVRTDPWSNLPGKRD